MGKNSFTKRNSTSYSDALLREVEGLDALRSIIEKYGIHEIRIPEILSVSNQQLELEEICPRSSPSESQMYGLGVGLARIHKSSQLESTHFGFATDNYIGLNPQLNKYCESWGEFFIEYRLRYQVGLIKREDVRKGFEEQLELLKAPLVKFLDTHGGNPSLCHGDLWSGNAMISKDACWLIDPAVYFADREVDLAMTEMFGGFTESFYRGYDDVFPRSDVYADKRPIYNLYHYLNHYNLFGVSYLNACEEILKSIPRIVKSV